MNSLYGPRTPPRPPADSPTRERLARSGAFDVIAIGSRVTAARRRWLPARGLLRLLLPRVVVRVRADGAWSLRPDGVAIGMIVVLLGGIVTELVMDRVPYPRDYPPEFVPGLALGYTILLIVEALRTRGAVRRALAA